MPTDPSRLRTTLLDAARLLARGGGLDERLEELIRLGDELTGATAAVIYLYDGDARVLLPVASHGLDGWEAAEGDGGGQRLDADDPTHPASRAVRERRGEVLDAEASAPPLTTLHPGLRTLLSTPLMAQDPTGGSEIEGVLVTGFESGPEDPRDAQELVGAIGDLAAAVVRQARTEQLLLERAEWLERVASTDPLTGLANRRSFDRMLELELLRAARQATPMSLVLVDIDGLASITERAGGEVGDDVLRRVASALADTVRLVDTIARFGSDEFAVLAPGAAGDIVARRIQAAVAGIEPSAGTTVSVSAGVARFPDDGSSGQELVKAAENALAQAKRQGAGTIVAGSQGGSGAR